MKNFFAYIFAASISMQPVTAFAVDYSDFDSFCQTLLQKELELIKGEVEEGLLTEAEAEEEVGYVPKVEQCVCFFQKVLEGTGSDFTLYFQKSVEIEMASDEDYVYEEIAKMKMPKNPEGLDIVAFITDSEKSCGFD